MIPITPPATPPTPVGEPTTPPIPPDRIDDLLPLTPAQTGMLFESLSNPDPEMYFEQVRFDLVGPLDLERFRAAWESAHANHAMLRTVFLWEGLDDPLQAVLRRVDLDWNITDGTSRSADTIANNRRMAGIDLGVGPISGFDLIRIDDQRTHVVWSFHHLLLDGWSTAQVVGEVLQHYEDHASHSPATPASGTGNGTGNGTGTGTGTGTGSQSDFRPYLEWLTEQDAAATKQFWQSLLAEVSEPTALVTERRAPAPKLPGGGFVRSRIDAALSPEDSERVRSAARTQRVTVNTMVQAAWARTLARYTGRSNVTFGVTVSGRPPDLDGANQTVGMFLNTLPFPLSVPDICDAEWLQSVQEQQLDVSQHGHAALAEVQRLAPGVIGSSGLFDSILVFENYPMRSANHDASVQVENYGVFEQSHYPLTIMAGDVPADRPTTSNPTTSNPALGFIVVADQSLLAPWFTAQLIDDFLAELVQLGSHPAPQPSRTTDAIASGSDELAATIAASLQRSTVDAAFAHRAMANADDVAVRCGIVALTFADLEKRAARVATALQQRGVGPEVPVGVAIERSIDMVVAILGIVRAGGCYLALDPGHPAERTSMILSDANAPIVLVNDPSVGAALGLASTNTNSGSGVPTLIDLRSLLAEATADPTTPDPTTPDPTTPDPTTPDPTTPDQLPLPSSGTTPESTLFLTFTSGSTGRPKGVPVHHRGVLHRLAWQYLTHPPVANEVGMAKTTLGFVDHLSELWGPLLAGQTVVLAPDATVKDVSAFVELCRQEHIRRLVVVPSYLEAMLEAVPELGAALPQLGLLTTSGEALPPSLARRAADALPNTTLLNIYGMSEATADVTVHEVGSEQRDELGGDPTIPVGRPLPGIRVAITGADGAVLPFGIVGSIEVAGVALSAGYWNRADLTAERFVDRPSSDGTSERWYQTGDLGWLAPDENLHVVGRSDHQVKIRGMRVELGEIEAAFERHPTVSRGVAVVRDPGEVVVFVRGGPGLAPVSELRSHARSLLPRHMMPAAILPVEDLPTTPTGKLDRAALVQQSMTHSPSDASVSAANARVGEPSDGASEDSSELATMIGLWRQVLPNASLGPDTDFFDAGGHSLLALRLVARINTAFDAELSLAQMLQAPTARRLTWLVGYGSTAATGESAFGRDGTGSEVGSLEFEYLVPILPGARGIDDGRRTIFCVHGAGGNVLNFRALANVIGPSFDMIGIQARGVDGVATPHSTMAEVVADYLPALRSHQPSGPYLLAGYSGGGTIAVEIARALEAAGEVVEATLLLDTFHNDTRPRPFTKEQHLQQLRKEGIRYLVEKLTEKFGSSESDDFAPAVSEAQAAGRAIPLEAREWFIKGKMYQLIGSHRIEEYDGTVVLLAATDTHPGLVHTGHDHGLGPVFPNLEIIDVEGDHHSLVEGHNAPELGRLVLERLGVEPASPSVGGPAADEPLDAKQHVYRHLPTGLDESPLLARFVRPDARVLDVGTAATGRSALALAALGAEVVSIEINHEAISEFANSDEFAPSGIQLATSDMARLPFADASFDNVLVAFHGFDYLVDPVIRAMAIADLARVLRPGGHLIFNSFNTLGILATPTGARSAASWKRRFSFVRSGELASRRLVDNNGLGLHHGRPGQIIAEVEKTTPLRFETMTTLFGAERHRLLVSAFAPEPNYVFTKR